MAELAMPMRRGPFAEQALATVGPCPPAVRFVFRGSAQAAGICAGAFGCDLPVESCRAVEAGDRAGLWLGPDEWLLLAEGPVEAATLGAALETALVDTPHSVVDVSHRQVALEAAGPGAGWLLNAGCPLDLHIGAFPVGMVTRTVLAKADITLWRREQHRFRIEVARSFAPYLLAFLNDAARG